MVAGETSGDLLGANLLSALRPQLPDTLMHGIGGPQMAKYDFVSNWPMEKLSVNGLFEVLAHYREIKGIHNHLRIICLRRGRTFSSVSILPNSISVLNWP